ncbi:MAG: hypothetical protein K2V38_21750, partial [Gemmataceae bacterium]|nr:hypothetical protein [Gemmataceae bacterium]
GYRLTQDMRDAAAALGLRITDPALTLKQVYADAPGQGSLVWRMGARGKDAAAEVRALFEGLIPAALPVPCPPLKTRTGPARQIETFEVV